MALLRARIEMETNMTAKSGLAKRLLVVAMALGGLGGVAVASPAHASISLSTVCFGAGLWDTYSDCLSKHVKEVNTWNDDGWKCDWVSTADATLFLNGEFKYRLEVVSVCQKV